MRKLASIVVVTTLLSLNVPAFAAPKQVPGESPTSRWISHIVAKIKRGVHSLEDITATITKP